MDDATRGREKRQRTERADSSLEPSPDVESYERPSSLRPKRRFRSASVLDGYVALLESRRWLEASQEHERLASSGDPEVRREALELLAAHPNDTVRARSLELAARVAGSSVVDALHRALVDPSPRVRSAALTTLGTFTLVESLGPILLSLADEAPSVRVRAALAASAYADPFATNVVLAAVTRFRQPALLAGVAGELDARALPALRVALEEAEAAYARSRSGFPEDDGLAHLTDPREVVLAAFERIVDPAAVPTLVRWLVGEDAPEPMPELLRTAALRSLPAIGLAVRDTLVHVLEVPTVDARHAVATALLLLGDASGFEAITTLLVSDEWTRVLECALPRDLQVNRATLALARIGFGAVFDAVELLLESTDPRRRRIALVALGHTADRRVTPHAVRALSDPDRAVRVAALTALYHVRDPAAEQGVVTLLARCPDLDALATKVLGRVRAIRIPS